MKTYILTLDESQEDVILALAKALKIDIQLINEADEDKAYLMVVQDGLSRTTGWNLPRLP